MFKLKALVPAAIGVAAAGLVAVATPAAHASTAACDAALPPGVCASWNAEVPGLPDLDVLYGTAQSGQALIVFPRSATDRAEDFVVGAVPSGATAKYTTTGVNAYTAGVTHAPAGSVFVEYAPHGVPSGFCVSTVNPNGLSAAQLRGCSNNTTTFNQFQTFVKDDTGVKGDGQFVKFIEVINNNVMTDPANNGSVGVPGNRVHVRFMHDAGHTGQLWGKNGA